MPIYLVFLGTGHLPLVTSRAVFVTRRVATAVLPSPGDTVLFCTCFFCWSGHTTPWCQTTAPAHLGLLYPCLHWANWDGLTKFDNVAITDADWYCMGCFLSVLMVASPLLLYL